MKTKTENFTDARKAGRDAAIREIRMRQRESASAMTAAQKTMDERGGGLHLPAPRWNLEFLAARTKTLGKAADLIESWASLPNGEEK